MFTVMISEKLFLIYMQAKKNLVKPSQPSGRPWPNPLKSPPVQKVEWLTTVL